MIDRHSQAWGARGNITPASADRILIGLCAAVWLASPAEAFVTGAGGGIFVEPTPISAVSHPISPRVITDPIRNPNR